MPMLMTMTMTMMMLMMVMMMMTMMLIRSPRHQLSSPPHIADMAHLANLAQEKHHSNNRFAW